mgnify:CR=1 FL=1|tara:strand:- start:67 stop:219 length:153 start_codon:yes stop_codon:yes gene_type:complete
MPDIKTMTQEVTELSVNISNALLGGDYNEIVTVLEKIVEKLDEVVNKLNE